MGSIHFRGGNTHGIVYHETDDCGRTAPTPTVFLAHEGVRTDLSDSDLAGHENRTNDVGLDVFEDIFGLKHGLHT